MKIRFFINAFVMFVWGLVFNQVVYASNFSRSNIELCSTVFEYKGEAYFCGRHQKYGRELFRSDSTLAGTVMVADIDKGGGNSYPTDFFVLRDKLYFFAETNITGHELWRTDGTPEGTKLIKDSVPGPEGQPNELTYYTLLKGDSTFYWASDAGIWRTDGTSDGTLLLVPETIDASLRLLSFYRGAIYFSSETNLGDGKTSAKLMRVDEGALSASTVKSFGDSCYSIVPDFTVRRNDGIIFNNKLLFRLSCHDESNYPSNSIFVSDGTSSGTKIIIEGYPQFLGALNGERYFFNYLDDRIYSTNGETSKTVMLCSTLGECFGGSPIGIYSFDNNANKALGSVVNGRLLFGLKKESEYQSEVWSTDGKGSDQRVLSSFAIGLGVIGDKAMLVSNGDELYVSSGMKSNTIRLKTFDGQYIFKSIKIGKQILFFVGDRNRINRTKPLELWVTDGTLGGTRILKRISEHKIEPRHIYREGLRAYFGLGNTFWHSDGTESGTYEIKYISGLIEAMTLAPIIDLLLEEE